MGESEKTLPAFNEVEGIFQHDSWFRWRYNIRLQAGTCEHWLAQGDLRRADEYAHRLLEIATHNEAHKYVAVAHKLLAQIAVARGDLAAADAALRAALDELQAHPVPVVAWKTYAALGRLRLQAGGSAGAREAFAEAADIVNKMAAEIQDEKLRATFLTSTAVREVLTGADENQASSET